jgi:hypothetical protein
MLHSQSRFAQSQMWTVELEYFDSDSTPHVVGFCCFLLCGRVDLLRFLSLPVKPWRLSKKHGPARVASRELDYHQKSTNPPGLTFRLRYQQQSRQPPYNINTVWGLGFVRQRHSFLLSLSCCHPYKKHNHLFPQNGSNQWQPKRRKRRWRKRWWRWWGGWDCRYSEFKNR